MPARSYHVFGVPLRSGSLAPGNEDDARAYRDAGLLRRLRDAGCQVTDEGDIPIPSYLPHHTVPPIRSWPGPRIVWECVREHLTPYLQQPGSVPLLIGCDCSVVVGTARALSGVAQDAVHVLYVDGGFDDAPPDPERSQSAAAMAVWLLTRQSPFWPGPLKPSQVTVVGASEGPQSDLAGLQAVPIDEVRSLGPRAAAQQVLQAIPPSAAILLHLDVDVIQKQQMPASYFPQPHGLTWDEARDLVVELLGDPRLRLVEISEYASLRDLDQHWVSRLVDLLVTGLTPRGSG